MNEIQLIPPDLKQIAGYAVWRTDFYICTGIAYAKSLGKTAADFSVFVGNTHNWEDFRGQGLGPPVQLLYFLIKCYPDGEFEILSQSDQSVSLACNRPYAQFFEDGLLLGVSLAEFETCLWQHIAMMASRIGLAFSYAIEPARITAVLAVNK